MKILGIDFGIAKIGLAIADNGLAQPIGVIEIGGGKRDVGGEKIRKICQKYQIEKIVVGLPEGRIIDEIKEFGEKLREITGLPVVFQDETLTTKEAIGKMIEAGKKKKYRQEKEDAFAAAIILQSYLDKT